MPRWLVITTVAVAAVALAGQLALPTIAERKVEDRLTEGGGEAEVTLSALPAARLLFSDGERFEVEAGGLDLGLDRRVEVFDRLDGFGEVDVAITDSQAGPFALESFELRREASGPYSLVSSAQITPADLVEAGIESLDLPGGFLLGAAARRALGDAETAVPIELDMQLTSDDGQVQVISGGGTVAGLPTGPLAELITEAIVVRL